MGRLDNETKQLLDEVADVSGSWGGGQSLDRPRFYRDILELFDRCRSNFRAVRLLTDEGYGQEALILARPLFTESLMLMELAEADERRRLGLVTGYALEAVSDLEGVFREAEAQGQNVTEQLQAMTSLKTRLRERAERHNANARKWKPNEKELARKHGRDGYLDFRMAHHFVHGSTFAAAQRSTEKDEVTLIGGHAAAETWALPTVLFAASSAVYATRAVSVIFGVEQPRDLDELLERIEERGRAAGLAD